MDRIADELRVLVTAHDLAVLQIYALDHEVTRMMTKMVKQVEGGHIIHGVQLATRRCIFEGVKAVFTRYQRRKLSQVQHCLHRYHTLLAAIGQESGHPVRQWSTDVTMVQSSHHHHIQGSPHQYQMNSEEEMEVTDVHDHPRQWMQSQQVEEQGQTTHMQDLLEMETVERDLDTSGDSQTLEDGEDSAESHLEEGEESDWDVTGDPYVGTIFRGLCLENCELHRGC